MDTPPVSDGPLKNRSMYLSHQFPPYELKSNEGNAREASQATTFWRNAQSALYWVFFHCLWNHLAADFTP